MSSSPKITALRRAMAAHGIDAYLISGSDPHRSEYVASRWASRAWLSGFTGSAGTLIVTADWAGLWTDSRYFIQAEQELAGSGIELMKLRVPHTPEYLDWLQAKLQTGQTLGYAGNCRSLNGAENLQRKLAPLGIEITPTQDLLDEIWTDRPAPPTEKIQQHPPQFADRPTLEKIKDFRSWMATKELDYFLVTALDEIAWLLNVRGSDIKYNPLVVSFLLIPESGPLEWFVGKERVPPPLLQEVELQLHSYRATAGRLLELASQGMQIGVDPTTTNLAIYQAAGGASVQKLASPIPAWKAIKNEKATAHIRNAMARDGVTLLRLRRWLESGAAVGKTEYEVVQQLQHYRSQLDNYQGDSFGAIVGYQGNGAIVHYDPPATGSATIGEEGLLLVDSGGQYLDGTTDITRTFSLGAPQTEERINFTLVLKGMIDLSMAHFPKGTSGVQLEILARQHLWKAGLNYGHGTGHGVGYFLNVHEGPASISPNPRSAATQRPLEAGMIFSNEPGYYKEGEYGIRCENLVQVYENEKGFLQFRSLTVFPFEKRLLVPSLLTDQQKEWLILYHGQVYQSLAPLLEDPEELAWLTAACSINEVLSQH
ncbi:MAG: aminopeptidase P family protein [Bacteroidota bacterium]